MKRIAGAALLALLAAALLAGCAGEKKKVLHVYNWSDYIKEELVTRFEKEFDCKVVMDFYDSNETMYAKLKSGAGGYDLLFPSSYMVKVMYEEGMLQDLDHAKLPNLRYVDPEYLSFTFDPQMQHSVPYMISNAGIGYLQSKVGDFVPSWGMFGNAEYAGRMTMLGDMRETVGAALKYLGYSLNSTDDAELAKAQEVLIGWKKNLAKFETEQYVDGLVSGEFVLAHGYNGNIMMGMEESEDLLYVIPDEGASLASDDMVIPVGAKEVDLAHAFINFIHTPDVAAENTDYVWFLCPNKGSYAMLPQEILDEPSIFMPEELLAKCEVIRDLGADNEKYTKVWDAVKAAQ